MKVLLTGGGTAGHINPALAIADIIRENAPGSEIEFVGIKGGREEDLVTREGYKLHFVDSIGFARPILQPKNLRAFATALNSPHSRKTKKILDDFAPDLVIGTGGYACWPIMKAAALRKIPTAVHESNALPGLAVKKLKHRVDRIWINFERTRELLEGVNPQKIIRVGNPLRRAFGSMSKSEARKRLGIPEGMTVILSYGGSLGAESINQAMTQMLATRAFDHPDWVVFHSTGPKKYDEAKADWEKFGLIGCENLLLAPYFYDLPVRMAAADIILARAGAMTVSELAQMGKTAVLVPSEHVVDNHQTVNAKALADKDAAILVTEAELAEGKLASVMEALTEDVTKRERLSSNIRAFADADTNRIIWKEIQNLIESDRKRKGKR